MNIQRLAAWLRYITTITSQKSALRFSYSQMSDEKVKIIGELNKPITLHLDYTRITGKGLRHLLGLQKLGTLDLSGNKITDTDLATLAQLSGISFLELNITSA